MLSKQRYFRQQPNRRLRKADDQLGFALPGLLRSIYRHVANGGIGPSYGLLGIASGATDDQGRNAVELYCDFLGYNDQQSGETGDPDHGWNWPERLLPICYRGCRVYELLDCNLRE